MTERKLQTAVVTGPTGAIGMALCQRLLDAGVTVYAVCRPGSPRAAALPRHPDLHQVECDATVLDTLPWLLAERMDGQPRADAFFHLAWAHTIGPGRNDMPAQTENIFNTLQAVRAAHALGCQVFVGVGSQAEYGSVEGKLRPDTPAFPQTGYGMAKLCAGQMARAECKALGLAGIWARVLSVYGPHDGPDTMVTATIRKLLAGQCPPLTAGEQLWDYLYAADAADALCAWRSGGTTALSTRWAAGRRGRCGNTLKTMRDAIDPALPLGFGQVPYAPNQVMHLKQT